jgi:hypothetical protein
LEAISAGVGYCFELRMNCFTNFILSFFCCCSTEQLLFQLTYVAAEKLQPIILLLAIA